MNSQPETEMKMPLKGLAIGDGLCDPLHQMDYGDFLYQVGLLDDSDKEEVDKHADIAKISMELEQWHQATIVSNSMMTPEHLWSSCRTFDGVRHAIIQDCKENDSLVSFSKPFKWSVTQLIRFFRDPKMAELLTGPGSQQNPL